MRVRSLLAAGCLLVLLAPPAIDGQQLPTPPAAASGVTIVDVETATLRAHPALQAQQRQVDVSRAQRQQRAGDFDTQMRWSAEQLRTVTPLTEATRLSYLLAGTEVASDSANLTTVTGSFSKLFRSGIQVGPSLEMTRLTGNLDSVGGTNRARVGLDVTVPLQRGRGRDVVTAPERAADLQVAAAEFDLSQTAADLLLTTADSYWRYVGAARRLEIAEGAETRAREYVANVDVLIKADRLPRSETYQVQANLAGRESDRIASEQQLAEARYALAAAMGLSKFDALRLPPPTDPFPVGGEVPPPVLLPDRIQPFIDMALANRADYLAAQKRRQAADALKVVATNGVLPQVDLLLSGGYAGLQEGRATADYIGSLYRKAAGPDLMFKLSWSRPFGNNAAQGQLAEADASYRQAVLLVSDKERTLSSEVSSAMVGVHHGVLRLAKAEQAVGLYRSALEGEKDKLRLAVGSLTDLLTAEDRLNSAMADFVAAQEAYAVALVQLRHATGTLVDASRPVAPVDRTVFFTQPSSKRPD